MNNKEYLNQISSDIRKTNSGGKLGGLGISPKMLKIIVGLFVAAIFIIVVGLIAGSGKDANTDRDIMDRVYLRTKNVSQVITDNNSRIKSPELRSMTNSLKAVLTELNFRVGTFLKEDYGAESAETPAKEDTGISESDYKTALTESLNNARISGLLDRTLARELTFNISMILSMESDIISSTKLDAVRDFLITNQANLNQLLDQFNNYSAQ